MARQRKYSADLLEEAVRTSSSYRQVLFKIGLKEAGGNYRSIQKIIAEAGLDITHFTGCGWSRNKVIGPKRALDEYLSNKYPIQSHVLRLRLIAESIFPSLCSNCNLEDWLDKPIPLELDHIDGNHKNNNLSNLRLLCPNCHAFTSTYRGKNKKS